MRGPLSRLRLYAARRQYGHVIGALLGGTASAGDDVARLEESLSRYLHVRHAIAMPRARTAIYFALRNLIQAGQNVILSPYTVSEVVNAVVCAGGTPVFADIERATCNISAGAVEQLIDGNTGAVLITHFYGLLADVESIAAICASRNVPLIEDAAQAFGARRGGRYAGTFGVTGIFSFGLHKTINSFFGGALVTDDDVLARKIRDEVSDLPAQRLGSLLSQVGYGAFTDAITWPPVFRKLTFRLLRGAFLNDLNLVNNLLKFDMQPKLRTCMPREFLCRLSPLQARLVRRQLESVENDTARRIAAARLYVAGLSDCPGLMLPPFRDDHSHVYWYFPIQYHDRAALVAHAMRHGRDITMSYHRNCANMPCFARWHRPCPNAEATANSLIYLPTYPGYTETEIRLTIDAIRRFFSR